MRFDLKISPNSNMSALECQASDREKRPLNIDSAFNTSKTRDLFFDISRRNVLWCLLTYFRPIYWRFHVCTPGEGEGGGGVV